MLFLIEGAFTAEEALAILQKVRDIEQARPEIHVGIQVTGPEMTRELGKRLLEGVKPPFVHMDEVVQRRVEPRLPFSAN